MDMTGGSQSMKDGLTMLQDGTKKNPSNMDRNDGHHIDNNQRTTPIPPPKDNLRSRPSANPKCPAKNDTFTIFSSSPSREWSKSAEHPTPTIKLTQALRQYPEQLRLPNSLVGKPTSYKPVDLWAKELLPSMLSSLPVSSSFKLVGPDSGTPDNCFGMNHDRLADSTPSKSIRELPPSSQPHDPKEYGGDSSWALTSIGPSSTRDTIAKMATIPESQTGSTAVADTITGRSEKQHVPGKTTEDDHSSVTQPRDKIPRATRDISSGKKAQASCKPNNSFTETARKTQAEKLIVDRDFKAEGSKGMKTAAKNKGKRRRRSFEEDDDLVPTIDNVGIPPGQSSYKAAKTGRLVPKDAALQSPGSQETMRKQGHNDSEEAQATRERYGAPKEDLRTQHTETNLPRYLTFKGSRRAYNRQILSGREVSLERAEEDKTAQTSIKPPRQTPTAHDLRKSMDEFLKAQGRKNKEEFDDYISSVVQENERNLRARPWDIDRMMAEARLPVRQRESPRQRRARQRAETKAMETEKKKLWVFENSVNKKQASEKVDDASALTNLSRATTPPNPFSSAPRPGNHEMDTNAGKDEVGNEKDDESESFDYLNLEDDQNDDLYVSGGDVDNESNYSGARSGNESPVLCTPHGDQSHYSVSDNDFDDEDDENGIEGRAQTTAPEDLDFPGLAQGLTKVHVTDTENELPSIRVPGLNKDASALVPEERGLHLRGVQDSFNSPPRAGSDSDTGRKDLDGIGEARKIPSTRYRDQRFQLATPNRQFSLDFIGSDAESSSISQADYSIPPPSSRPGAQVDAGRGQQEFTDNEVEIPMGQSHQVLPQRGSIHSEVNWQNIPNRGRASQPRSFQPPTAPRTHIEYSQPRSRLNTNSSRSEGNSPSSPYRGGYSQSRSFQPITSWRRVGTHIDRAPRTTSGNELRTPNPNANSAGLQRDILGQSHSLPRSSFHSPVRNQNSIDINSSLPPYSVSGRGPPGHRDRGGERESRGRYSNSNEGLELFQHLSSDRESPSSMVERSGGSGGTNSNRGRELFPHLSSDRGSPRSRHRGGRNREGRRRRRDRQTQRYRETGPLAGDELFRGLGN